jgi:hypothetical protein
MSLYFYSTVCSGNSKSAVQFENTTITPADLMNMPEEQRIALLKLVKTGRMTMDEALQQVCDAIACVPRLMVCQVVEHKNRQNCVIS